MESFFALLPKNVLDRQRWNTREELRLAIITWIERTCHRPRRQRRLGRLTPVEHEALDLAATAAHPPHPTSQTEVGAVPWRPAGPSGAHSRPRPLAGRCTPTGTGVPKADPSRPTRRYPPSQRGQPGGIGALSRKSRSQARPVTGRRRQRTSQRMGDQGWRSLRTVDGVVAPFRERRPRVAPVAGGSAVAFDGPISSPHLLGPHRRSGCTSAGRAPRRSATGQESRRSTVPGAP
jgi:hypothetical protein